MMWGMNKSQAQPQSFFFSPNALLPLGLYVASVTCTEFFGKFSRQDSIQILDLVKHVLRLRPLPAESFKNIMHQELPRLAAPALYMASAITTLYNADQSRRGNQHLRQQVAHIDQTSLEIKADVQKLIQTSHPRE
jgi:hypothetical protein